jgi:UDP-N-acetylglucosamine 2-epimerase (non-hydrolysing)
MFEVLSTFQHEIEKSDILSRLNLKMGQFLLVSAHREENIEPANQFAKLVNALNVLAERYNMPIIVSTHPRTRKKIESLDTRFSDNIKLIKPLGFLDYNKLQISAKAVLSDSGTITEESSILNFPALNIRENHERPEGMVEGVVMMVGFNIDRIIQGLNILENQGRGESRTLVIVDDYNVKNVSDKVVRIIHSYIDYINQLVWKKY